MPLFTRGDLDALLAHQQAPCISLTLPTHLYPPHNAQDPIRLRNLVRTVDARLAERGVEARKSLIEPLEALAASRGWAPPTEGLAVYRSPDLMAHYSIPMALPERWVVSDTFHVRPLLRYLQASQRYYVLALSLKQVRLFEGTPLVLNPATVDALPASLHDALGAEHDEAFLNVRTVNRHERSAVFHGHGGAEASGDEDLRRYLRLVSEAVSSHLRHERAPLFLACVAEHVPLFREVCRYPHITRHTVEGNVDDVAPAELHRRVWPAVEAYFRGLRVQALEDLALARGRGLVALDLPAIARHAVDARVRRLVLAEEPYVWGRMDRATGDVQPAPGDGGLQDDVLDDVAETVMARGGTVQILPEASMPERAVAAALLRW